MKILEEEAKEYADGNSWNTLTIKSFMAGANSKWVQSEKIKAQIEVLDYQVDKLDIGVTKTKSMTEIEIYTTSEIKLIQGDIMYQIQKLKEQLKKLEDET